MMQKGTRRLELPRYVVISGVIKDVPMMQDFLGIVNEARQIFIFPSDITIPEHLVDIVAPTVAPLQFAPGPMEGYYIIRMDPNAPAATFEPVESAAGPTDGGEEDMFADVDMDGGLEQQQPEVEEEEDEQAIIDRLMESLLNNPGPSATSSTTTTNTRAARNTSTTTTTTASTTSAATATASITTINTTAAAPRTTTTAPAAAAIITPSPIGGSTSSGPTATSPSFASIFSPHLQYHLYQHYQSYPHRQQQPLVLAHLVHHHAHVQQPPLRLVHLNLHPTPYQHQIHSPPPIQEK